MQETDSQRIDRLAREFRESPEGRAFEVDRIHAAHTAECFIRGISATLEDASRAARRRIPVRIRSVLLGSGLAHSGNGCSGDIGVILVLQGPGSRRRQFHGHPIDVSVRVSRIAIGAATTARDAAQCPTPRRWIPRLRLSQKAAEGRYVLLDDEMRLESEDGDPAV